jgi:hypothetical protein
VARFYREPRLVAITLILSSTFFLSGVTIQHTALLNLIACWSAAPAARIRSASINSSCITESPTGAVSLSHQFRVPASSVPSTNAASALPWHVSSGIRGPGADKFFSRWRIVCAFSSFNSRGPRAKVAEGSHYFCRVHCGSAMRSGCKSLHLVVHQPRPEQRLVICKFIGCRHHRHPFLGWSAVRSRWTRDRLFRGRAFHWDANSLLFCGTAGTCHYG